MKNLYWLILIIVFALLIRIIFFIGPVIADEFAYLQHAHNIFSGKFDIIGGAWYAFRFAVFLPVGIFFKLFNISDYATSIWPLFCSLGSIVLTFLFGKSLFDIKTAILATLLLAIFPLDILYATHVMPDTIFPLFISLAIYLFLKGEKIYSLRKSLILYLLSGIILGLGYLAREVAPILFFLYFIAYILYRRSFKLKYIFIVLGFLLIFITELVFYYLKTGDFLIRWHITSAFYGRQDLPGNLLYYPKVMFSPFGYFGLFYYFVFGGLLYLLFSKKLNDVAIPLFWFLSSFLYWEFGTMSLFRFVPIFKEARFLSEINIPIALLVAYFLMALPLGKIPIKKNHWLALEKILILIFILMIIIIPFLYLFNEKIFFILKNIYNLTKHGHSFEENIEIFNTFYKMTAIILPLLIAVTSLISFFIIRSKKIILQTKLILVTILLVLFPSSILSVNIYSTQYKTSIQKYKIAYQFIKDSGCKPIYCIHWRWPIILSYYFQYKEGSNFLHQDYLDYSKSKDIPSIFKYVQNVDNLDQLKGSCVIVDKEFLSNFLGGKPPPAFIYHIPFNWEIRKRFRDITIYYVK